MIRVDLRTQKYAPLHQLFTVFIEQVYGSLWRWKYWSVRQTKPVPLAFGRTL